MIMLIGELFSLISGHFSFLSNAMKIVKLGMRIWLMVMSLKWSVRIMRLGTTLLRFTLFCLDSLSVLFSNFEIGLHDCQSWFRQSSCLERSSWKWWMDHCEPQCPSPQLPWEEGLCSVCYFFPINTLESYSSPQSLVNSKWILYPTSWRGRMCWRWWFYLYLRQLCRSSRFAESLILF